MKPSPRRPHNVARNCRVNWAVSAIRKHGTHPGNGSGTNWPMDGCPARPQGADADHRFHPLDGGRRLKSRSAVLGPQYLPYQFHNEVPHGRIDSHP
jgi:hypothetical protein